MATPMLAPALIAVLLGSLTAFPVPYHAFCNALWLFASPCTEINNKLVQQIEAFTPLTTCDECQYTLVSATSVMIKANHTSPDGVQAENITFTFSPTILTGGCRVSGKSVSLSFSSLLDGGLNYCNLYNLLAASGLTAAPGFMEMINEWSCLSYGLSTCNP